MRLLDTLRLHVAVSILSRNLDVFLKHDITVVINNAVVGQKILVRGKNSKHDYPTPWKNSVHSMNTGINVSHQPTFRCSALS